MIKYSQLAPNRLQSTDGKTLLGTLHMPCPARTRGSQSQANGGLRHTVKMGYLVFEMYSMVDRYQ